VPSAYPAAVVMTTRNETSGLVNAKNNAGRLTSAGIDAGIPNGGSHYATCSEVSGGICESGAGSQHSGSSPAPSVAWLPAKALRDRMHDC